MITKLIDSNLIQKKILELSIIVNNNFKEKLVILGVMNGSYYFMKDLISKLDVDYRYDFVFCSSYYGTTESSGSVDFIYPRKEDIKGKNVVVLEDIVDSGETLLSLKDNLSVYEPLSLSFCSMIVRESCILNESLFWTGFKIKNEFVVGYGLDYDGDYRNLVDIYELKNQRENEK